MTAPLRADARRNRDRLLAAARAVFAELGPDASLDAVARRAGVGNATMYRHFPARRDLIVAVYADEVAELCALGTDLLEPEPAGAALFRWLRAFVAHVAAKRDLALAIPDGPGTDRPALFAEWHEAMHAAASALLDRARRAGDVTTGVTAPDLLALANGIALAGADEAQVERLLNVVERGTY